MADAGAFHFLLLFRREIERVTQKNVCVSLVPRVDLHNGIEGFSKSNFLHGMKKARLKRASKHNRQSRNGQLRRSQWNIEALIIAFLLTSLVHHSVIPLRKSRPGLPTHRDILKADRVVSARRPAIDLPS